MSKLPVAPPDEEAGQEKKRREQQADAICASVISALGRPADLFRVSAVQIWKDHYRVNVQTGADAVSTRIAHSFFVATDERGNLIESSPRITRVY
jgi:glutathione S-transferase